MHQENKKEKQILMHFIRIEIHQESDAGSIELRQTCLIDQIGTWFLNVKFENFPFIIDNLSTVEIIVKTENK